MPDQRSRILSALLTTLLLGAAFSATSARAQCTGKAYLESVTNDGVKLYHYTSDGFIAGTWFQRNCVGLANLGSLSQSSIVGEIGFASGQGSYTISTSLVGALSGGQGVQCAITPTAGPDQNTIGVISPAAALGPGEFTDVCCFVFEAEAPTNLCESVPGPGDTSTVQLDVGGSPTGLTAEVRTTPQDAACGLLGIEAALPFGLAALWRRRRRAARSAGGRRRSVSSSNAATRFGVVLALAIGLATSPTTTARAETFTLGGATDVALTLEALVTDTQAASLSGTLDVEVGIDGLGNPTQIRFAGGALTVQPIALQATFDAVIDVEADLLVSTGFVDSPWIPVLPTGVGTGTFDVASTDVEFQVGVIQASGPFFDATVGVNRNFLLLPLSLDNEHTTPGTITATPNGGGSYDVVVELPVDVKAALSWDTAGVWLAVDDGLIELEGEVGAAPVPSASRLVLAAAAGAMLWIGRRTLRGRPRVG